PERLQAKLVEAEVGRRLQLDRQRPYRPLSPYGRPQAVRGRGSTRVDIQRPERRLIAAAEAAGHAAHRSRMEQRFGRHLQSVRELPLLHIEMELHQGDGGDRPRIVWIRDVEQRLAELRAVVLEPELYAGGEEGEPLEEPLHVRVVALGGLEEEARGDFRVALGEVRTRATEVAQLPFVLGEQRVTHPLLR